MHINSAVEFKSPYTRQLPSSARIPASERKIPRCSNPTPVTRKLTRLRSYNPAGFSLCTGPSSLGLSPSYLTSVLRLGTQLLLGFGIRWILLTSNARDPMKRSPIVDRTKQYLDIPILFVVSFSFASIHNCLCTCRSCHSWALAPSSR